MDNGILYILLFYQLQTLFFPRGYIAILAYYHIRENDKIVMKFKHIDAVNHKIFSIVNGDLIIHIERDMKIKYSIAKTMVVILIKCSVFENCKLAITIIEY